MTSTTTTSTIKKYRRKAAYMKIQGSIMNPQNARQIPLDFECRVDTGFDGGIWVPHWYESDVKRIDIEPRLTSITLADGSRIPAYVCVAHLHKMEGHIFPRPGKPVMLVMCGGSRRRLLGMDALKHCVMLFDGPKQCFTLTI